MEFLPLHRCPDYKTQCAEVLNEEWKRSLSARLHSLEKSRDNFPICLVLFETQDGVDKSVVGHSRLSDVFGQTQKSCLIESVVVKKSHRGKGYGRIVMQRTEQFAASKGYKVMYLTTHDKQDFYKHLGYEFCSPVLTVAFDILPDHLAKQLMGNLNLTGQDHAEKKTDKESPSTGEKVQSPVESLKCDNTLNNRGENSTSSETTSHENRSQSCVLQPNTPTPPPVVQAPPPPPPPPPPAIQAPPPPPPPVIKSSNKDNSDSKTVVRWDLSKISWMKKYL